jgi:hypothetical protein
MKLDLLTNGTLVDDRISFVTSNSQFASKRALTAIVVVMDY